MAAPQKRLLLAGAAVGATALVLVGWRLYRRRVQHNATNEATSDAGPRRTAAQGASEAAPAPAPVVGTQAEITARLEEAQRCKERGNKRVAGQQYPQAIKEYTAAIELAGEDASAKNLSIYYGNRAQCHFALEAYDQAIEDCNASLDYDPKYVKALVRRATTYEKLQRLEPALVDFSGAGLLSSMQNQLAVQVSCASPTAVHQRLQEPRPAQSGETARSG